MLAVRVVTARVVTARVVTARVVTAVLSGSFTSQTQNGFSAISFSISELLPCGYNVIIMIHCCNFNTLL